MERKTHEFVALLGSRYGSAFYLQVILLIVAGWEMEFEVYYSARLLKLLQ